MPSKNKKYSNIIWSIFELQMSIKKMYAYTLLIIFGSIINNYKETVIKAYTFKLNNLIKYSVKILFSYKV